MKVGENDCLMRKSFSPSFMRIRQKSWNFTIGQFFNVSLFSQTLVSDFPTNHNFDLRSINFIVSLDFRVIVLLAKTLKYCIRTVNFRAKPDVRVQFPMTKRTPKFAQTSATSFLKDFCKV